MSVTLRPFRYRDLDAIIALAQVAFADEFVAQGLTVEGFGAQVRLMMRARMIPLQIVSALMRFKWELWVAEADSQIVGCGAFSGRKRVMLHTLMVDPRYRRRGIGQALLSKRLERIQSRGFPCTVVTSLQTNAASLGNLAKQDFQIVDQYSLYEHTLPLHGSGSAAGVLTSRPLLPADRSRFIALEHATSRPEALRANESSLPHYLPSIWMKAADRLGKYQVWNRAFLHDGQVIGFLSATTTATQAKGLISRPLIEAQHARFFPAMLEEAAGWVHQQGKETIQINLPDDRPDLIEAIESGGWTKLLTWVDLAKWFGAHD